MRLITNPIQKIHNVCRTTNREDEIFKSIESAKRQIQHKYLVPEISKENIINLVKKLFSYYDDSYYIDTSIIDIMIGWFTQYISKFYDTRFDNVWKQTIIDEVMKREEILDELSKKQQRQQQQQQQQQQDQHDRDITYFSEYIRKIM